MRILVLLKNNSFYLCSQRKPGTRDDYRRFGLVHGGEVEIPEPNILSVETYTDSTIETFRRRLHKLQQSQNWTELTNEP